MKRFALKVALAAICITPVWAATNTVTLVVPGMTCAACPIMMKRAISKLEEC